MNPAAEITATRPESVRLITEDVCCGVCGQPSPRRLYTESYRLHDEQVQLGINRCHSCAQVYVSPRLNRRSTANVYVYDKPHTISHNYCWAGQTSDERFTPLLDRLSTIAPRGRLLDVGCGSGSFLAAAHRRKRWQLLGVDPHPIDATDPGRAEPFRAIRSTLEEANFPKQHFDVVTLLGVLEHLHDPLSTLKLVHRLLQPGGVLAIYVPNFHYLRMKDAGIAAWMRHRQWSRLAPQEHLFHFTPTTLKNLLHRSGFEIVRLDVGYPFIDGKSWRQWLKRKAFAATTALYQATGIHVGGLEAIARPIPRT